MVTVLKILGIIWLGSVLVLGFGYLWYKITNQPIVEDYEGEDF